MYLKRLEISGFKSFAGKSVLDFEKDAKVSAVVGPNGSGKSNIADAVRWVLGEQSYKTIRSKKSEDVIFSGSNSRAKSSFAKVAMVLDNAGGKAPIDFSEVEISRTVFRDGSSEYLINGKKSRLLDVAELLARSGFGQSTYSVIGQGMVDSMLFYGPAERKVLFDEAAGVRGYEIKREQTIKKLEDTNQNIIRIKDILSELNPRLNTLKRQAEKAKEKDTIKDQLLEKQKTYFASVWDRISHTEKTLRADLEKVMTEEAILQDEIADLNQKFSESISKEQKDTSANKELEAKIAELESKKDALKQQIYTTRARIDVLSTSGLSKSEIEAKIKTEREKLNDLTIDSKEAQKEKLAAKISAEQLEALIDEVSDLESKKDALKQEIYTLRARIEVTNAPGAMTAREIEEKIKELQKEINSLLISQIEKKKEEAEKEVAKAESEVVRIQEKIDGKRAEVNRLSEELAGFDFGKVGNELSKILEGQNLFLIKVESAQDLESLKEGVDLGRQVSKELEKLIEKVGGVKDGKISGMTEIQMQIEELTTKKEAALSEKNAKKSELLQINFEIKSAQEKRQNFKTEIERLKVLEPVDNKEKSKLEKEISEKESGIEIIQKNINSLRQKIAESETVKNEIIGLDYAIRRENEEKERIEAEIERLSRLKPVDEKEKIALSAEISERETQIEALDDEITKIKAELAAKNNDFSAQGKILSEIKDSLYAKQKLLAEYNAELTRLKIELAKSETKKQDLRDEIIRELGSEAVLADAKMIPELHDEEARAEIEKLKNKLYAIGEIDPEVETEFGEVSERVGFLSGQIEDLEKAKNDLEKLISELDTKIKKQFQSSFAAISAKFTHFFNLLFGGGTAKLELMRQKNEDEEESEQLGIEITAIPPGKKIKSLSALSGGERTLTSLALLFAILSVNPAPFCILDEVDAALDETNTKKFLKIVQELSSTTQFIFISHNRETMKAASIIYGITIDETHASKIISIKLEDALETAKK